MIQSKDDILDINLFYGNDTQVLVSWDNQPKDNFYTVGYNKADVGCGTWTVQVHASNTGDSTHESAKFVVHQPKFGIDACFTPERSEAILCEGSLTYQTMYNHERPSRSYLVEQDFEAFSMYSDKTQSGLRCNRALKRTLCFKYFARCDDETGLEAVPCGDKCLFNSTNQCDDHAMKALTADGVCDGFNMSCSSPSCFDTAFLCTTPDCLATKYKKCYVNPSVVVQPPTDTATTLLNAGLKASVAFIGNLW